jgi:hypothetical protein
MYHRPAHQKRKQTNKNGQKTAKAADASNKHKHDVDV